MRGLVGSQARWKRVEAGRDESGKGARVLSVRVRFGRVLLVPSFDVQAMGRGYEHALEKPKDGSW